jgi:hypothetical protein
MGLTLVLEVHNIIIHSLCKYIMYNNLNMYKLGHYFYDTCPCCTHLVARRLHTQSYGPKIIQYQICSYKQQPVAF